MNKAVAILLAFAGVFLILLGMVFVIAGGENILAGGLMIVVGLVLMALVYLGARQEARRPTVVQQSFNVQMGGSGQFVERQIRCPSCGAPLTSANVTVVEGGLMANCPYCGKSHAMEEQPKW
jgi:drug/metabolite transporter (DMT)-like permease